MAILKVGVTHEFSYKAQRVFNIALTIHVV
jgi:hypothetical protein